MKSKVTLMPDIEALRLRPDQRLVERGDHEKTIEEELDFVRRKHSEVRERAEGEAVEEGDAVVIDTSCSDPEAPGKFKKSGIGLSLGKFFYDRNIEQEAIGRKVGETFEVKAGEEEFPVTVTIVSARYTALRPLTDEDFLEEGKLNGVETPSEAAYIEFLEEEIRAAENLDHFYDNIIDDLTSELVEKSEFEIDEEEFIRQCEIWYSELEDLPDYMEDNDEVGFIEYVQDLTGSEETDREALNKALKEYYDQSFKYNLILMELAKDFPDPTREEYEEMIESFIEEGYTRESLEETTNYESFVRDRKLETGQNILRDVLERQLEN